MRVRKGSTAALKAEVESLQEMQSMALESQRVLEVERLRAQNRAVSVVLEAERTELLARVQKIEATLELLGRTRSRGTSPEW